MMLGQWISPFSQVLKYDRIELFEYITLCLTINDNQEDDIFVYSICMFNTSTKHVFVRWVLFSAVGTSTLTFIAFQGNNRKAE